MALSTARKITANFVSLLTSQVISRALQLLIFVYLARVLGKEDFGILSFAFAFSFIMTIIADFGLSTLYVREISRDKNAASKYLSNGIIIKIFLSIITAAVSYLFLELLDYSAKAKAVAYIMLAFTLIQLFTELFFSIFRAFEKMHYEMLIKVLRTVILVALVFYSIKKDYGLFMAALAFPLSEIVVVAAAMLVVYGKFVKISLEFDYEFSKKILRASSLFFFSIVFSTIYMYIDQVMISKLRNTTEVGVYSAAANLIMAFIFIPLMYGTSIYPAISRFYISSKKSLRFAYERSFKYMAVIGLPVAAGIFILADKIILLLYGGEYLESAKVLKILAGYLFLKFLNPITGFTLMAINKQGTRLFSQGTAAVLNIILNIILIPEYGIIGAAAATLITEIVFFITYISFIMKYGFGFRFIWSFIYKILIAAFSMGFLLFFLKNLFLGIASGAAVYFLVLYFLGMVDKEDKYLLNKIIKNI